MIQAAVRFYDVVLFFHVAAIVISFGPTFAYAVFFAVAEQAGSGERLAAARLATGRSVLTWDRLVGTIGMAVILATGMYLVADEWEFADFFVSWGFAAILVLFAMTHAFFIPQTRRYVAAAEAGREEEVEDVNRRLKIAGPLAGLIVILTIYVMTAKPFI